MSDIGGNNIVFVIDEDPAIYKALRRIGKEAGFSVLAFDGSREFFSWLESNKPNSERGEGFMCIVLAAKTLVVGLDWYANDLVRSIPKICIGIPEEVKSIIEMLTVLQGQFIRWPFRVDELREAVTMGFVRHASIIRDAQASIQISEDLSSLSRRENEVFCLVAQGHTNQEISDLLGISIKTVKAHRSKVMKKTKSKTIPDLVRNYEKRELMLGQKKPASPSGGVA